MHRQALVIVSALTLGGCASASIGSIAGGECKIVRAPEFVVRGKTKYDQGWVNRTTEAIVVGCQQPRPKARPASLDAPAIKADVIPIPKPKPGLFRRLIGA